MRFAKYQRVINPLLSSEDNFHRVNHNVKWQTLQGLRQRKAYRSVNGRYYSYFIFFLYWKSNLNCKSPEQMAEWSVTPGGCVPSSDAHTMNIPLGRARDSRSNHWSLWEFLGVRIKHHFTKDSTMFFKVNMSAILLQHECISIIKFMTGLFFLFSCILLTASQHVPKSPEYVTTTGYNTAGKMPQNTEKLLDLLLLFPAPVSPTATKGTQCKASTAPWLWSSSQHPLWKSWLFKEVSPSQQTVLLKLQFLFSKPAAHHQGQNLGNPALIWKSPPGCYVRAVELAGDGSCTALQSSGRRKKKIQNLWISFLLTGGLSLALAGGSRRQRVGIQPGQKGGSWKFASVWGWNGDVLTHVRLLSCHTLCTHSTGNSVGCRCSYLFISVFINNKVHILTARINIMHLSNKHKPQVFESPSLPPSLQICFNQGNS